MFHQLTRRYGNVFTINMPIYGRTVVVADPQLVRQILTSSPEDLGIIQPNPGRLFGGARCSRSMAKSIDSGDDCWHRPSSARA